MLSLLLAAAMGLAQPAAVNHGGPPQQAHYANGQHAPPSPHPLVCCLNPNAKPGDVGGDQVNERHKGPSPGEWGLIAVGALQALILGWQISFLGKTLTHQRRSDERQQRAYVYIEDAVAEPKCFGKSWEITYIIKNGGKTPAHKVKTIDVATVVDWPLKNLPPPRDEYYCGSMGPNGDWIDQDATLIGSALRSDIISKKKAILLRGTVSYEDVFNRERKTHFCFYLVGKIGAGRQQMTANDEGNDST